MYALMAVIFVFGYLCIALEHPLKIDKAASALLTAVVAWTLLVLGADSIMPMIGSGTAGSSTNTHRVVEELRHHLGEISEILFFLMGAMTIVELIDAHEGFKVITDRIRTNKRVHLLWLVGLITFFLSAALDNLATTIVMISLLRKLIADRHERWFYAGIVVIAANAGGAWSPIGDVTTTMLWIGGQVSATGIISQLFLPSLACLLAPLILLSFRLRGEIQQPPLQESPESRDPTTPFERNLVFGLGLGALIFVPIFKTITHLPPYMGILFGLGLLWVVTEVIHRSKNSEEKDPLSVVGVLRRIDITSVLFFLGILLAVSALSSAGHLIQVATLLKDSLGNVYSIAMSIGLLSAVVDNVPMVAGAMKMYPLVTPEMLSLADVDELPWLSKFVINGNFWEMLAYCAGTGGSCLIIGSAAGVAAMGMEKINFIWYLKRITGLAFLGYLAGAGTYVALVQLAG
ncbi:sodium:proton antiporter NhaD [Pseudomonas seleniipraecipitans]|jgi:Na+/H+ antiporter NhaD/arsenite permease-like protein|uniref:Sodium/proton antiporter, NhaD family n=1 Tax=Phytopseudomonas seleniipraecipitans TaxID=640205 RepID=A0A1G7JG54_9GAMM|nr:sodium:proton antiporter NhaD [Pseudomonas seleniipraecipitans]UUD65199.1 sodium:proton antiporter NhaD [Pseudomonas seleniipraecipitans]SDF23906.1 sodium/proton antiporter, NhaD family [Pseudomonas seleniipraecipitans]